MGIGDWIIATAEAKEFHAENGLPVVFAHSKTGAPQWSEVFENNPKILKNPTQGQKCVVVRNHAGTRPYHLGYTGDRFIWNPKFKPRPGELFLTDKEKSTGDVGCVLIEPNTKDVRMSHNKAWPWDRWQRLVKEVKLPWVQVGARGVRTLEGVKRVFTASFRESLGWLYNSSLLVTTDGALHHAAAALGKPAVVLWGGLAPPSLLGYDLHTNICHADRWCGSNFECDHCKKAMESITVEEVKSAIERMR